MTIPMTIELSDVLGEFHGGMVHRVWEKDGNKNALGKRGWETLAFKRRT